MNSSTRPVTAAILQRRKVDEAEKAPREPLSEAREADEDIISPQN